VDPFQNRRLSRRLIDQAALHGMLKKVRDLGMPLLSVNRLGDITLVQGKEKELSSLV
jgi:hypothetical protein